MIKRRTAKTIADLLHEKFRGSYTQPNPYGGPKRNYKLQVTALYDFLYENEYEAWFLNAAKTLRAYDERSLKEFIMRLHTGETVATSTPNWTWQQRTHLGQRLLRDLAEDILITSQIPTAHLSEDVKKKIPQLLAELELDGYLFRDDKLYFTETAVLDTQDEEGILEKLIKDLALGNQNISKHVLKLSETHYVEGRWDDSISNSRKFLESILQEISAAYCLIKTSNKIPQSVYDRPVEVRNYLEAQGIIEPKEKEAIAKIYGLMSETGSHPYIAHKDQARLMRYLSLTFAQFALLRFQGVVTSVT